MKRLVLLMALTVACADKYERRDDDVVDHIIPNVAALPGVACPGDELMRVVTNTNNSVFCIDAFEASVDGGALGNASQAGGNDTADTLDGSTSAKATVGLQASATTGVSFYQAKASCENAGKRLCTVAEWERACRGPESLVYPYGDDNDETACNGFFAYDNAALPTGSLDTCGSEYGVFDLSGNVAEWTASATPRIPGSGVNDDRAIRGGSFNANAIALRCVGDDYHGAPSTARADLGFRCCK